MACRVSLVTPSYNQGRFLEATVQSVLGQSFPGLEYAVIDGGSADESPAILQSHSAQLAHWCSERDNGQYDAINKGFLHTTGEVMVWLNSDDMHTPWTLSIVAEI